MPTYTKNLTSSNSLYVNLVEPDDNYNNNSFMRIGNSDEGIGNLILLRLPPDVPRNVIVSSSTLKMPEYDSDYRGSKDFTAKISPVTELWSTSAKWNTCPAYDTSVVDTYLFNKSAPSASNWDLRDGYHAAKYYLKQYHRASTSDSWTLDYTTSLSQSDYNYYYDAYNGADFYSGSSGAYYWNHLSKTSAYYDTHILYHTFNIKNTIQKCVNSGYTSIIIYYDLPGTSDTRKYIKSIYNTDSDMQPVFKMTYTQAGCRVKNNGTWTNGIVFVNDGGTWKQGVMYAKDNSVWKPSI
jgi:hypothetical protein